MSICYLYVSIFHLIISTIQLTFALMSKSPMDHFFPTPGF